MIHHTHIRRFHLILTSNKTKAPFTRTNPVSLIQISCAYKLYQKHNYTTTDTWFNLHMGNTKK